MSSEKARASEWRPIDTAVVRLIEAAASARADLRPLLSDVNSAEVRNSTEWILDVRGPMNGPGVLAPDGPLDIEMFVPSRANYQGEILIWITAGHLSGIEYSWVTDEAPTAWPDPTAVEINA